jgi:hypothetical protein
MTDPLTPPAPPPVTSDSKGKNCWVIGCGGCLIALLVLVLVVVGIGMWIKNTFLVEPFEPVSPAATEQARMEEKFRSYNLLNDSGQLADEFTVPEDGMVLTEDEVNYLISTYVDDLSDSVRIDFEPGEITANIRVGEPGSQDRWSLSARISLEQTESGLDVRLLDVTMGGFALPKDVMAEIGAENLAEDAFSDPEFREQFEQNVEKIEVQKDQILLLPRKPAMP